MALSVNRVLDPEPCPSLAEYVAAGGGRGLLNAQRIGGSAVIQLLEDAGLRGRGGAGFPTFKKWQTVVNNQADGESTPVLINAAEGEPSTFKDHAIVRNNPYRVLEGALIGCQVVNASKLVICAKSTSDVEWERIDEAVKEMKLAGWTDGVEVVYVAGPSAYLFGEETAMLEVVEHRQPFPRVTPPWRRGVDEATDQQNPASLTALATTQGQGSAPALVNNVETFAQVALIVTHGAGWFREHGTIESPGTTVCTVVGDVQRHAVGEFPLGTPLLDVITELTGGPFPGRELVAVLPGASSAVVAAEHFDTPLTIESFALIGSSIGSCGFYCIDDQTDLDFVAYSLSRFLSVESCGQCVPCKEDGLAITEILLARLNGTADADLDEQLVARLSTVADQARCSLALQQQVATGSMIDLCRRLGSATKADSSTASSVLPILDLFEGVAVSDESNLTKQPDWSHNPVDSGRFPAQLLQDTPIDIEPLIRSHRA